MINIHGIPETFGCYICKNHSPWELVGYRQLNTWNLVCARCQIIELDSMITEAERDAASAWAAWQSIPIEIQGQAAADVLNEAFRTCDEVTRLRQAKYYAEQKLQNCPSGHPPIT